ncbi:MAG: 3-dehydroquinate synthase [candidate division Zixibacteria bacterium]|nr:3-dehydroquinate synthase [candidate division Zixibacteria bacterium]
MHIVKVNLGLRSYPVLIGSNEVDRLTRQIDRAARTNRLFVFFDANLYALHGDLIKRHLRRSTRNIVEMVIPGGEKSKSATVLNQVYDHLLHEKISRDDFILACGGGVLSDLIGYAAATILRGVRWGVVPTTLLGMVDAAVGGKTGINHRLGKNLVGAFWQPAFVYCDTYFLHTLPSRQMVAGLGEVAKYAALDGGLILDRLRRFVDKNDLYDDRLLRSLIIPSVRYKAGIVAQDERESGRRILLNLGHTFAHAIENAAGYGRLLHGEAVILGLLAAVELSSLIAWRCIRPLASYRSLLEKLITWLPQVRLESRNVLNAMALDKKRSGLKQRFLILKAAGEPIIADNISIRLTRLAVDNMLEYYRVHGGTNAPYSGR